MHLSCTTCAMTWQVYGPHFEQMDGIDETARTVSNTLHDWLRMSDSKERAIFLDAAFQMIESTRATTVGEILGEKLKNLRTVISSSRDLDPERKKEFNRLAGLFLSVGVGNVIDRYRSKKPEEKTENSVEDRTGNLPDGEKD